MPLPTPHVDVVTPYRARVLAPDEWYRLPAELVDPLDPTHTIIVIVEDVEGRIVARWAAITTVHLEGLYVEPDQRGNPNVARLITAGMMDALQTAGVKAVLTLAQDNNVRRLAQHFGFVEIPGTLHQLVL